MPGGGRPHPRGPNTPRAPPWGRFRRGLAAWCNGRTGQEAASPEYRTNVCQVTAVTFPPFPPPEPRDPSERVLFPFPPEIDFSTASGLLPLILSRTHARPGGPPGVLVLDLTPTRFMDSQGVRLINEVRQLLRPRTRVHVVARPDGLASHVLEVTGLRRDVPVYDNLPEAMAA